MGVTWVRKDSLQGRPAARVASRLTCLARHRFTSVQSRVAPRFREAECTRKDLNLHTSRYRNLNPTSSSRTAANQRE